jgi:trimeric autotransporter adhesin
VNQRFALAAICLDKVASVFLNSPDMKTSIPSVLITFSLVCFGLLPKAQAVVPAPDGGYPGSNTAEGQSALFSLTTGVHNTALGFQALFSTTTGSTNMASGSQALVNNTTGFRNTAAGFSALSSNTIGFENTATGCLALSSNTVGQDNTANGEAALLSNTTGGRNTANGAFALFSNTSGFSNTATGVSALVANTTGVRNTADGVGALGGGIFADQTGSDNTAVGFLALHSNETGDINTAIGEAAMAANETGSDNTAIGFGALHDNIAGSNNIAVGFNAGDLISGDNNIDIGHFGVENESNTIRIGTTGTQTATYIAGISGATVPSGVTVIVGSDGHLGTMVSSARFKHEIKPMDKASEALFSLKPVAFRYKKEIDLQGIPQFGLVAEDVEKVNPDLVVRDKEGKPYTVRYDAVNAMLLNEFLKEHRKVEKQETTIAQLRSEMAQQQKDFQSTVAQLSARLDEQASQIQKVSAQLEVNRPAPQMISNNR